MEHGIGDMIANNDLINYFKLEISDLTQESKDLIKSNSLFVNSISDILNFIFTKGIYLLVIPREFDDWECQLIRLDPYLPTSLIAEEYWLSNYKSALVVGIDKSLKLILNN